MNTLWQDLRYTLRVFARSPGIALVMALTLALGIGLNTAVFTLFDAFVLKPAPVSHPETLVHVKRLSAAGEKENLLSYPEWRDLRDGNHTLAGLAAYNKLAVPVGAPGSEAVQSTEPWAMTAALLVSGEYFSLLGARPALGRLLAPEDDRVPGGHPVVVVSHGYWERKLASAPDVLGRTLELRGQPFTIVGVTERGFIGTQPDAPDLFVPLMMRDQLIGPGEWGYRSWFTSREAGYFLAIGRLRDGVARDEAEADLRLVAARAADPVAGTRAPSVVLSPANALVEMDESFLPIVLPVAAAVLLVLLTACANVANLMLARASGRQREIALRLSLGASRGRLVRQLLTESALVGLLGGGIGLLLADWSIRLAYPLVLAQLPPMYRDTFQLDLGPDLRVFAFMLAVSLATGLLFGLAPALSSTRADLATMLRGDATARGGRVARSRLRSGLLVAQVATSVVLLVSAGLLVRGLVRLRRIDVGFQTVGIVSVALHRDALTPDPAGELELRRRLAERLADLPGVRGVTEAWRQPLTGRPETTPLALAGEQRAGGINLNRVASDYFATLGLRLLRGRAFTTEEAVSGAPVVVISEATARRLWPGEDPLGKEIRIGAPGAPATVVGVAADTRSGWVWEPDATFAYLPLSPLDARDAYLLVDVADEAALLRALPREAVALDPRARLSAAPLASALSVQMKPFQAAALAAAAVGALALALAAVGVFGVASYLVRQRVREVGIRMALGADRAGVVRLVLGQSLRPIALGVGLGLLGAAAAARLLRAILAGLSPLDPVSYLGVALLLAGVALLATWGPARWASRIDPIVALRADA